MPDVIRVTISHFQGERPRLPAFDLAADPDTPVKAAVDDTGATFSSGTLTARFTGGDAWRLDFLADGRVLTGSGRKGIGVVEAREGSTRPPAGTSCGTTCTSNSTWASARPSTDWASGSVHWSRTVRRWTPGTTTVAPAANWPTRTCHST
ncbi:hypothetical protein [Micromonospora zhanjiangensis]